METTRRTFVQLLGAGSAAALLTGCGEDLADLLARNPVAFAPPGGATIDLEQHVLNRLTWGGAPGNHERLGRIGVEAFIDEQLDPDSIPDRACNWRCASFESLAEPVGEMYETHADQLLEEMTRNKLTRAVYSRRQLYEVMVDFWTDHFNIVASKDDCRWLKAADDRDVVRAHAMGRFIDLVRASAISAAMLVYLDGRDNAVSSDEDRPNENYARELLELHTLGVGGGYSQRDVMEVARCLSGWTYQNRPFKMKAATVAFDASRHDDGAKRVLGHDIPAGGGADDLDRVLEIVCHHPSTARYVCGRLCRRFIADPAPQGAVDTVAAAFLESEGDIRTTLRALFTTDEFRVSRGTLLKRPMRFIVSALRATDARSSLGGGVLTYLDRMGHAPFQYPTPDGYPLEPQPWLGSLLWRWNFAAEYVAGRIDDATFDLDGLTARSGGPDGLAAHLLGRTPTDSERAILAATGQPVALLLASPAFQYH